MFKEGGGVDGVHDGSDCCGGSSDDGGDSDAVNITGRW